VKDRKLPLNRKSDKSIAEIIGTLLVFSMMVTFTTAFLMYYVPTTGANNERAYLSEAQNTITDMSNQLNTFGGRIGASFSQEIPMGIQGSFFNQNYATESGISGSEGNYHLSYSLSLGIQLEGYNPGESVNYNKVVGNINTGASGTDGIAYDSQNGFLYVINYQSKNITVVNGATNQIIGSIPGNGNSLQGNPVGITYDSGDNLIYVSLQYSTQNTSGYIAVINPASNQLESYIPTSYFLYGIVYDSESGRIFASFTSYYLNPGGNSISGVLVYNATSQRYFGMIAQPADNNGQITIPSSVSYDPSNGLIYLAGAEHIWAIDGVTDKIVLKIPINSPWIVAFDAFNGNVYATAAETTSQNGLTPTGGSYYEYVYVINGTTNQIINKDTLNIGEYPTTMIYDPGNRYIYVANYQTDSLFIINGVNNKIIGQIAVGNGPGPAFNSLTYDSANGEIYVVNLNSDNLTAIQGNTILKGSQWEISNSQLPLEDNLNGSGTFFIQANTQFVPSTTYAIEDSVPMVSSNGHSTIGGNLPFAFNTSSSGYAGLDLSILSINSSQVSYSTTQNLVATFTLESHNTLTVTAGELLNLVNISTNSILQIQVLNVYIDSFSYEFNSTYAGLLDYSLYMNTHPNSNVSYYYVLSLPNWTFENGNVNVFYKQNSLSIQNTAPITLYSISINQLVYDGSIS
jgi:YVTN family beta-propeller protein